MGPAHIQEPFIQALNLQDATHIADKLTETQPSEADISGMPYKSG